MRRTEPFRNRIAKELALWPLSISNRASSSGCFCGDLQNALNPGNQLLGTKRFRHEISCAGIEAGYPGQRPGNSRDNNDGNVGRSRVTAENLANGITVEFRQHQVQKNQVGMDRSRFFQAIRTIGGTVHFKSGLGKVKNKQLDELFIVFNYQNLFRHVTWTMPSPYDRTTAIRLRNRYNQVRSLSPGNLIA